MAGTTPSPTLAELTGAATFADRHVGPDADEIAKMLAALGYDALDEFIAHVLPDSIRSEGPLQLPPARSEEEALAKLRTLADQNTVVTSMIGMGYYGTHTPAVIRRNILENPAWYTAYTPYQPEISQGRLEALINFQTMVCELTGLAIANASLLDEGTAVAEAMTVARRTSKLSDQAVFVIDANTHPQTIAVVQTRAEPLGLSVVVADLTLGLPDGEVFGLAVSQPGSSGRLLPVATLQALATDIHGQGGLVVAISDLLALMLIMSPGQWGADVAVGSSQRFGVPLANGGPHAAFMAVRTGLERAIPGRLVGTSQDSDGNPAHRLALQTREQHIRRERATSNICTAQVLLAVIAGMYAVYHGPEGLAAISERTHRLALILADGLRIGGIDIESEAFFDTITARVPGRAEVIVAAALEAGINIRHLDADRVGIACDETTTIDDVRNLWQACGITAEIDLDAVDRSAAAHDPIAGDERRTGEVLVHQVFHEHHSETSLLRYLRRLADRDLALDRAMIPLGSCTMKLNASAEMEPITWPEFANIHPFAPSAQRAGYTTLIEDLESAFVEITGYAAVSLQPNAGSQGELAGLLAIRGWQRARGATARTTCLIPSSAHGTNAASAVMAGYRVVVVSCDDAGNVDLGDLRTKIAANAETLGALMITYPSTHGVFEEAIGEICAAVHDAGGQVYLDGANLNAMVGLARPGRFGADVSHLNLHKTFCIPHGGGGPGIGPIAVGAHLVAHLPNHPLEPGAGPSDGVGPIAAAPYGSAGILPIPWMYLMMMGPEGLKHATEVAILNANYIAARLDGSFPVLYTGRSGHVAHECIVDLRPITKESGVTVDDVAKRLIDYGFHAPTMSFPVPGTLMIEPTESEDLGEIDRFCDAMIAIRAEIDRVIAGDWPVDDNPLHHAPHTAQMLADDWDHPYSRSVAAYPLATLRTDKYYAPVRRIDSAWGDRNLQCSCPSPTAYED